MNNYCFLCTARLKKKKKTCDINEKANERGSCDSYQAVLRFTSTLEIFFTCGTLL